MTNTEEQTIASLTATIAEKDAKIDQLIQSITQTETRCAQLYALADELISCRRYSEMMDVVRKIQAQLQDCQ